jgi:hypothetical protein
VRRADVDEVGFDGEVEMDVDDIDGDTEKAEEGVVFGFDLEDFDLEPIVAVGFEGTAL